MNRIVSTAQKYEAKLKTLSPEKIKELSDTCKMELFEIGHYQTLKNIAMMHKIITLEEANTIYRALMKLRQKGVI